MPFSMEVRRSDVLAGTSAIAQILSSSWGDFVTEPLSTVLGTFSASILSSAVSSLAATELVTPTTESMDEARTADSSVLTGSPPPSPVASPIRMQTTGATMGPLALRTAAAFGPGLGTPQKELTTSVDRSERAYDLATTGSDSRADLEL